MYAKQLAFAHPFGEIQDQFHGPAPHTCVGDAVPTLHKPALFTADAPVNDHHCAAPQTAGVPLQAGLVAIVTALVLRLQDAVWVS